MRTVARAVAAALGGGVLALFSAGCGADKDNYTMGEAAYARGNYKASADIFASHTGMFSGRKDEAAYYSGMSKLNAGDTDGALADFKSVGSGDRTLRARALDGQARTSLRTSNPGEAERLYRQILKDYRQDYPEEDALGGLMNAKTAQGDAAGAQAVRQEIARKYPGSPYLSTPGAGVPAPAGPLYKVRLLKAFSDRSAAQTVAASLKSKGIETMIYARPSGGYGIQVGAFSSQARAQARLDGLRAYGYACEVAGN